MEYLKESNKTSFTLDEISNETNSDELWGIQQFKILIPYIEDVVKEVNLSDGEVVIELMEGLIDDAN